MTAILRKPVKKEEIKERFKIPHFEKIVDDLRSAKIIQEEEDYLYSISKELHFPPTDGGALSKIYKQLDLWDPEFATQFQFEAVLHKFMLRRVSPRFLPMIEKQTRQVIDLIQMSEEVDNDYNSQVVQVQFTISKGEIPG